MFIDTYYQFTDYAAAESALDNAGLMQVDEEGNNHFGNATHAVDMVGSIIDTPGVYDEDGYEVTPPVFAPGFRVNIRSRGSKPSGLEAYEITTPETPARVWA